MKKKIDKYADHKRITLPEMQAMEMMGPKRKDGSQKGFLLLTFSDTTARVMDKEKEVGSVSGCIGGGVQLSLGDESYYIDPKTIWNSFVTALGKPEKKMP